MTNFSWFQGKSKKEKRFFLFSILIASVGILLSLYSTVHHLAVKSSEQTKSFACNINAVVSCDKVALSNYSEFFQIPLGVWGVGFFCALLLLLLCAFKFSPGKSRASFLVYSLFILVGILCSFALGFVSIKLVGSFCLVCLGVYLCNFLLAGLLYVSRESVSSKDVSFSDVVSISALALTTLTVCLLIFYFFKPVFSSGAVSYSSASVSASSVKEGFKAIPKRDIIPASSSSFQIPLATSPYIGKGEDFRVGSDEATIVIHEFVDFQCPACRVASSSLKALMKDYPKRVLVVFRNYPLDNACNKNITRKFHGYSCAIASLARCAGRAGKFWEFHDLAFGAQEKASLESATEWGLKVGLSQFEINNCLQDKAVLDKIRDDISLGDKLGVKGTPAIYVNGKKFEGDFNLLRKIVEKSGPSSK